MRKGLIQLAFGTLLLLLVPWLFILPHFMGVKAGDDVWIVFPFLLCFIGGSFLLGGGIEEIATWRRNHGRYCWGNDALPGWSIPVVVFGSVGFGLLAGYAATKLWGESVGFMALFDFSFFAMVAIILRLSLKTRELSTAEIT